MPEMLSAPLTPGQYGAALLWREMVAGGLREVRGDVAPLVPELLRPEVEGYQQAGRLAEIGAPYAEMSNPSLTREERRAARSRSAHTMLYVGAVANQYARTGSEDFLHDAHRALVNGEMPSLRDDDYGMATLEYAATVRGQLGLEHNAGVGDAIDEIFQDLNRQLLAQYEESQASRRDPRRLMEIAMGAGAATAEMAAVAAAQPTDVPAFTRFRQAARAFGAIGFLEDQATGRLVMGNLETYASAVLREEPLTLQGVHHAMRRIHAMRRPAEAQKVHEGMSVLEPGRERNMYGSQLWFAQRVHQLQRLSGLPGRRQRVAQALAPSQ